MNLSVEWRVAARNDNNAEGDYKFYKLHFVNFIERRQIEIFAMSDVAPLQ